MVLGGRSQPEEERAMSAIEPVPATLEGKKVWNERLSEAERTAFVQGSPLLEHSAEHSFLVEVAKHLPPELEITLGVEHGKVDAYVHGGDRASLQRDSSVFPLQVKRVKGRLSVDLEVSEAFFLFYAPESPAILNVEGVHVLESKFVYFIVSPEVVSRQASRVACIDEGGLRVHDKRRAGKHSNNQREVLPHIASSSSFVGHEHVAQTISALARTKDYARQLGALIDFELAGMSTTNLKGLAAEALLARRWELFNIERPPHTHQRYDLVGQRPASESAELFQVKSAWDAGSYGKNVLQCAFAECIWQLPKYIAKTKSPLFYRRLGLPRRT